MNKIIIVVEGGVVQSVLSDENALVEIVDFDGRDGKEQDELSGYVAQCERSMKQLV